MLQFLLKKIQKAIGEKMQCFYELVNNFPSFQVSTDYLDTVSTDYSRYLHSTDITEQFDTKLAHFSPFDGEWDFY